MLYQICNGAVRFAATTVLENINFEIRDTEKIAVVGRNGCGKSTLLKLIAGEVELSKRDSDEDIYIAKAGNPNISYLKQTTFEDETITLEEEIHKVYKPVIDIMDRMEYLTGEMDKNPTERNINEFLDLQEQFFRLGGYEYAKDYDVILNKFGFGDEDKKKTISEFSGGQRTKIAFVKLLLSKPDIMLLDEPTNHLDIEMLEWLEGYLKTYDKAVVIVSHDRMFLDKVTDVVYEIEYKTAKRYPGNYSAFVKRKRLDWDKQYKDYVLQQKEIERLTALVERFKNKPTKVAMTRSKLKQIEHMEKIEKPARYDLRSFHANFTPDKEGGVDVLTVANLQIGYDDVLAKVSFEVKKGQKVAVIGSNGSGKSTLLKTLIGQMEPLGGSYQYGFQIETGYFDQKTTDQQSEKTVIDDFWDEFPSLMQNEVRSCLGAFMFSQDDVFKNVNVLSGGEKARFALAKILKRKPNFLILDEPTNNMDIVGKESLESVLNDYSGSVLFVSHDRYFVQQVADALLIFDKDQVIYYPYGYEQYMEERNKDSVSGSTLKTNTNKGTNTDKNKTAASLFEQASSNQGKNSSSEFTGKVNIGKEQAKQERRIQKLESNMTELECKIAELKEQMNSSEYATNYYKLSELTDQIAQYEEEYEEMMFNWGELV